MNSTLLHVICEEGKKSHFKMHISSFKRTSEAAGGEGESNQKGFLWKTGGCSGSHLAAGNNDELSI